MMGKSWWIVAFLVVGILLGMGILWLIARPPRGAPIELLPPPTEAPIMVYVSGAINQVGIYTLPAGSRVNNAIQAAGGFSAEADTQALNLAELLEDGEKIDVPYLSANPPSGGVSRGGNPKTGLIDINSATIDQLDTLPEVGPKTAQNIIDYREANGPFLTIEALLDVPGIGPLTFEKIKDLITAGTSP